MNEIIKAMETRRSIRGYKEDMVPEELIAEVVEAGTYAATGMGSHRLYLQLPIKK